MKDPMTDEVFRGVVSTLCTYMPGEDEDDDDSLFDHRAIAIIKKDATQ